LRFSFRWVVVCCRAFFAAAFLIILSLKRKSTFSKPLLKPPREFGERVDAASTSRFFRSALIYLLETAAERRRDFFQRRRNERGKRSRKS